MGVYVVETGSEGLRRGPTGAPGRDATVSIDPSENVKALNEAASKRQDDLREADRLLNEAKLDCLKKIIELNTTYSEKLAKAESRRVDEQLALRAEGDEKLRLAEAKRIDAIRAVDVNAVAVANQRSAEQASALASQVAASAEVLRNLVAATANTTNQAVSASTQALSQRITTLEQASYQSQGKSTLADPAMVQLLEEVRQLRAARSVTTGETGGRSQLVGLIFGAAGFLAAAVAVIAAVVAFVT